MKVKRYSGRAIVFASVSSVSLSGLEGLIQTWSTYMSNQRSFYQDHENGGANFVQKIKK
jgi:hypothetical protein